jgi:hypothetical protein
LRGIEIAAVPASTAATVTTAIATPAAAITEATAVAAAIVVDLCESVANAQSEGGSHRAHRDHANQFHKMFFAWFGLVWFDFSEAAQVRAGSGFKFITQGVCQPEKPGFPNESQNQAAQRLRD